jgi:hypothetical protein
MKAHGRNFRAREWAFDSIYIARSKLALRAGAEVSSVPYVRPLDLLQHSLFEWKLLP